MEHIKGVQSAGKLLMVPDLSGTNELAKVKIREGPVISAESAKL
jgi:hypothetical protein